MNEDKKRNVYTETEKKALYCKNVIMEYDRYVCQSAMQPLSSGIIEVMSELRTCHKIYQECRRSETVLKGNVQIKGQKTFENVINLHRFPSPDTATEPGRDEKVQPTSLLLTC